VLGPTVFPPDERLTRGNPPAWPVDKPGQIGCSRKLDKKYQADATNSENDCPETNGGGSTRSEDGTLNFTSLLLAPLIPPGLVTFLPFVLIIAVFYLMLVRPNQKKQKQWQEMLGNLRPGDRITTTGGMRGTVISIKEDAVQLRVPPDNIKLEVIKSAIASVTANTEEAK
jgi:preprotein translocase subunit YajC